MNPVATATFIITEEPGLLHQCYPRVFSWAGVKVTRYTVMVMRYGVTMITIEECTAVSPVIKILTMIHATNMEAMIGTGTTTGTEIAIEIGAGIETGAGAGIGIVGNDT